MGSKEGGVTSGGEVRSEFQRDYDRALFSSAVRRLQHKAQVFPLEPNDRVRNRLTHSLEVSCIARSLAERWLSGTKREIDDEVRGGIAAVCATAGLLHDLGNPPFGHAGEAAIAEWFAGKGEKVWGDALDGDDDDAKWARADFLKFEGNAQTMRIVLKLQSLLGESGLNLTYGTLSACRKYVGRSVDVDKTDQGKKKPGWFRTEREQIVKIEAQTGTGVNGSLVGMRHPLTYLVEAADDIVYCTGDLEDGLSKGILDWEQVKRELEVRLEGEIGEKVAAMAEHIDGQLDHHIGSHDRGERNVVAGQLLRTRLIGVLIESVVEGFEAKYDQIMCGVFKGELVVEAGMGAVVKACKGVGYDHVYGVTSNVKLEVLGRKVIMDLLDLFWDAVRGYEGKASLRGYDAKVWELISPNYRGLFERWYEKAADDAARWELKLHLVTDYVCGMTDHYARQIHRELLG